MDGWQTGSSELLSWVIWLNHKHSWTNWQSVLGEYLTVRTNPTKAEFSFMVFDCKQLETQPRVSPVQMFGVFCFIFLINKQTVVPLQASFKPFYASTPLCVWVVCPSVSLEGISLNLAQTSTWSQGRTNEMLVVKGHCDLTTYIFNNSSDT